MTVIRRGAAHSVAVAAAQVSVYGPFKIAVPLSHFLPLSFPSSCSQNHVHQCVLGLSKYAGMTVNPSQHVTSSLSSSKKRDPLMTGPSRASPIVWQQGVKTTMFALVSLTPIPSDRSTHSCRRCGWSIQTLLLRPSLKPRQVTRPIHLYHGLPGLSILLLSADTLPR
jgi:hypothetical protein